jgi:hypothetical protein
MTVAVVVRAVSVGRVAKEESAREVTASVRVGPAAAGSARADSLSEVVSWHPTQGLNALYCRMD